MLLWLMESMSAKGVGKLSLIGTDLKSKKSRNVVRRRRKFEDHLDHNIEKKRKTKRKTYIWDSIADEDIAPSLFAREQENRDYYRNELCFLIFLPTSAPYALHS